MTGARSRYDAELAVALDLAVRAGELQMERYERVEQIDYKSARDVVTEVDHMSEALILDGIRAAFPGDALLAEETGEHDAAAGQTASSGVGRVWVIDPLDGTINYANGIPMFCVSIALVVDGTPVTGDVFTVQANTGGSGDGRNAEALAGQESKQVLDGGRASALDSYAGLVARVGSAGQQARTGAIARQALVDQATSAREAVSGVNLDEEAANMVQLQQAYQAAAQIIAISDALFSSLLNAVAN